MGVYAGAPIGANEMTWTLADFCDHAVSGGVANLQKVAAQFPLVTAGESQSVTAADPHAKALRLGASDSIRQLTMPAEPGVTVSGSLRDDLTACHLVVSGTTGARAMFEERLSRVESEWRPTHMSEASLAGWMKPAAGGELVMVLHEDAGSTDVVVITKALMAKAALATLNDTLTGFSNALVPPCIAAALTGGKPDITRFASHFEIPAQPPGDGLYFAKTPFVGVGLVLPDKDSTCELLISMGSANLVIAKQVAETFAATPGASVSEVKIASSKRAPKQAWQFTDAATGKSVRITLEALSGSMVVEIGAVR